MQKKLAFDIGVNNGDDTEYYLKKGYRVVAIDANPKLCDQVAAKFAAQIQTNDLFVVNVGVGDTDGILDFYVDTWQDTTSTFVPQPNSDNRYKVVPIPTTTLSALFSIYGRPDLLKIDIEGYDLKVLANLSKSAIKPKYISIEAHEIDVLCLLVCMGYDQFKIVDSAKVHGNFASLEITTLTGARTFHNFNQNSSGPFGEDLPLDWQDKNAAFRRYFETTTSWRDIQAKDTRPIYIEDAQRQGVANPEAVVSSAFSYWSRYPDVANDSHYGKYGELGFRGAHEHYSVYGTLEKREWPNCTNQSIIEK